MCIHLSGERRIGTPFFEYATSTAYVLDETNCAVTPGLFLTRGSEPLDVWGDLC